MAILRRTEKAMMRAMCGVKPIEKRRSQELMSLLSENNTLDGLARANEVRWYGHVLRRDNVDVLRRVLDSEMVETRGHKQPNMTWKKHTDQIGLKMEDATDGMKWHDGVLKLFRNMRQIRPPAIMQTKPVLKK